MKQLVCSLGLLSLVTFQLVHSYATTDATENPEEISSTHIPHILSEAESYTVREGESVTFHCNVDELGPYIIIWKKDELLYFAHNVNFIKHPSFTASDNGRELHIKNVQANNSGTYLCQISTEPPQELAHQLNVVVPPSAKPMPKNGTVIAMKGENITFGCETAGYPKPIITWTHSNDALPGNMREENYIVIADVQEKHGGIYECTVTNGIDEPAIAVIHVNIYSRPKIEIPEKIIYTGEEATAKLSCIVYGEPSPKVTWMHNGNIIYPSDEYHLSISDNIHTLQIRKMAGNHFGFYTCKAENTLGAAVEKIQLTGLATPVEFKKTMNELRQNSFIIKWSVKSHSPVIQFLLKFREQNESSDDKWIEVTIPAEYHKSIIQTHNYEITGLEPATVYEAKIFSRNKFGWNNNSEIYQFATEGATVEDDKKDVDETTIKEVIIKEEAVTIASGVIYSETPKPDSANPVLANCMEVFSLLTITAVLLYLC